MSDNTEIQNTNWFEEAIDKKYLKYYDYNQFSNVQRIDTGNFGSVLRANWKSSEKYFALKSFHLDTITEREIILKIHREVDYHDNIIRFYGITKDVTENQNSHLRSYCLVMEYADGGSLRSYLKENHNNLTWDDKYKMAYQLACAVSCLHDEGIMHLDLHSNNILIHQKMIKLADFGLSKRIDATSYSQSGIFGIIPYIEPKSFNRRRNNNNQSTQIYSLKSDIYSIGVLLWEISSGRPPFYVEGEQYDVGLAMEILEGLRESVVPDTPKGYVEIYKKCWDGEPDNRLTIHQVINRLKAIIGNPIVTETIQNDENDGEPNYQISNEQGMNSSDVDSLSNSSGELNRFIRDFSEMNIEELNQLTIERDFIFERDHINVIFDRIVNFILKLANKGIEPFFRSKNIIEYFDVNNAKPREIYNLLLNNNDNLDSIFLLGYFYYSGIVVNKNYERAFNLFLNASRQNHILAQYHVGLCYQNGYGIKMDGKSAFEYFEKVDSHAMGQTDKGYCYNKGIGVDKDLRRAAYWYNKAANNGNAIAQCNLAIIYRDGKVVDKNYEKAFRLFKQSAEGGYSDGITMLGYCYDNEIGTDIDKQKAFRLYQKAAKLENRIAQYNLAIVYESGLGEVEKNIDEAIYWYEKSANNGYQNAQIQLDILLKNMVN
ncbi:hypothetical protein RclHR1_01460010 [Rhizophagus clarus]|uniref:Kinase-like domain-containing protein n=1 Tax=Rhizophagus clarus TaxID=94130 RepID=A0A2Z6QCX9_9GLOM|nr:hypothetical protein RclHR1_01460010 [Rhizophagus clarus]GET04738.1 kinase-like domain-containing protein [Rhizophagus clarus]